jgi:hypothetical protein
LIKKSARSNAIQTGIFEQLQAEISKVQQLEYLMQTKEQSIALMFQD